MIRLTVKRQEPKRPDTTLTLPWEQRTKSRQHVVLDNGREAGLFLDRGTVLRAGDLLASDENYVVEIRCADEPLSVVTCDDPWLMARACYHLGNRHALLAIVSNQVRYPRDPVLDEMVAGFGLAVRYVHAPFEPEPGAYAAHGHAHA